jgi:anti-anti-sigma factor
MEGTGSMAKFKMEKQAVSSSGGQVSVLLLGGHLDAAAVPELEREVANIVSAGVSRIVFDLKQIEYISSAGLGLFLGAHRKLSGGGGTVILSNVSEEVLHILKVLGFDRIIHCHPDVPSALRAIETA